MLVAEDSVEERWQADRAADVRAEADRRAPRPDGRTLTAGRAARGARRVVGVVGASVDAVSDSTHIVSSDVLVVPSGIAPAASSRGALGAVSAATSSRRATTPEVNGMPSSAIASLIVQGTP